jgi:hypothetical protein
MLVQTGEDISSPIFQAMIALLSKLGLNQVPHLCVWKSTIFSFR